MIVLTLYTKRNSSGPKVKMMCCELSGWDAGHQIVIFILQSVFAWRFTKRTLFVMILSLSQHILGFVFFVEAVNLPPSVRCGPQEAGLPLSMNTSKCSLWTTGSGPTLKREHHRVVAVGHRKRIHLWSTNTAERYWMILCTYEYGFGLLVQKSQTVFVLLNKMHGLYTALIAWWFRSCCNTNIGARVNYDKHRTLLVYRWCITFQRSFFSEGMVSVCVAAQSLKDHPPSAAAPHPRVSCKAHEPRKTRDGGHHLLSVALSISTFKRWSSSAPADDDNPPNMSSSATVIDTSSFTLHLA